MRNSLWQGRLSLIFFLLTLALALFSWMGSVYGVNGVQSLLSAEGIRWVLGHVLENYVLAPALGIILVLLMGLGVGFRSGLYDASKRFLRKGRLLSRKERRALTLAVLFFMFYVVLLVASMFLPWNLYWSVTGDWLHSPFSKGFIYLLSMGIGLVGMVYGYVAGSYRSMVDVMQGMSCLIARKASYFVTLFFVVQFFSSLEYVCLAECLHLSEGTVEVIYQLCSYLPLFF